MASDTATERSPLLSKAANGSTQDYETANGTATLQSGSTGDPNTAAAEALPNGSSTPAEPNAIGPDSPEAQDMRKRMKFIFLAVAIGVFLAAADQTIIVSSYGKIGSELGALNKVSWIANAYFLTLTAFQPMYGKLSDIFGRKACLIFAYSVFGLGCLFCGLSRTMYELIFARAFAGIGGSGMTTVVSILISDIIPLRERGTWQGYINIVYASGASIGAPLGGIIADYINWRWAFIVQTPMCLIAIVSVYYLLKLPKLDQSNWKAKFRRIDFLGAVILLAAVATLLTGLDIGSNKSWSDKIVIICLALAVPLLFAFIAVERYVAAEPFAPGRVIFERSVLSAYMCNYFAMGGWFGTLFYAPYYFQAVYDKTATQASLLLIPAIVCGVTGSLLGGIYMQKTGKYYTITVVCYGCLVVGMAIFTAFSGVVASSIPGMIVGMMICGLSSGVGITSTLIALLANSTPQDQAVATACSYLFRSLGSVSGLALCSTALNQVLRTTLHDRLGDGKDANRIADRVRRDLGYLKELEPRIRDIVRQCYAKSTRVAFSLQIVLVSGAVIAAIFIREKPLNR